MFRTIGSRFSGTAVSPHKNIHYKPCASLMKLADKYSIERLDKACEKALGYTPSPSLKNISTILKNGQDKVVLTSESARVSNKESLKYGITRGASYYKGGDRS